MLVNKLKSKFLTQYVNKFLHDLATFNYYC